MYWYLRHTLEGEGGEMNSFIALSGIGSAAIDSCLDSKLLQPLFIDSTKTQFVHPSHNSPTTDAPLNQFIDLVVKTEHFETEASSF